MKISVSADKPIEITPDCNNLREVLEAIEGCYDRRDYWPLPQLLLEAHYWRKQMEKEIVVSSDPDRWACVAVHYAQKQGVIIYATGDDEYCLLEGCDPGDTFAIYKTGQR